MTSVNAPVPGPNSITASASPTHAASVIRSANPRELGVNAPTCLGEAKYPFTKSISSTMSFFRRAFPGPLPVPSTGTTLKDISEGSTASNALDRVVAVPLKKCGTPDLGCYARHKIGCFRPLPSRRRPCHIAVKNGLSSGSRRSPGHGSFSCRSSVTKSSLEPASTGHGAFPLRGASGILCAPSALPWLRHCPVIQATIRVTGHVPGYLMNSTWPSMYSTLAPPGIWLNS